MEEQKLLIRLKSERTLIINSINSFRLFKEIESLIIGTDNKEKFTNIEDKYIICLEDILFIELIDNL